MGTSEYQHINTGDSDNELAALAELVLTAGALVASGGTINPATAAGIQIAVKAAPHLVDGVAQALGSQAVPDIAKVKAVAVRLEALPDLPSEADIPALLDLYREEGA